MNAIITVNYNPAVIKSKDLKRLCADFERAVQGQDTLTGTIALTAYRMQQLFATLDKGNVIDGYKNYADFMGRHYGVAKAQAYNLAKAGSFLTTTDKKLVIDKWSVAAKSEKAFSNTAIVRIAEFINAEKKQADRDKREEDVIAMISNGVITQTMSIKQLTDKLKDFAGGNIDVNGTPLIETTATEKDSTENDSTENDSTENDSNDNKNTADSKEKTVTVTMSEKTYLALKIEMVRFTSMPEYGKRGLPAMWAFLEEMHSKYNL